MQLEWQYYPIFQSIPGYQPLLSFQDDIADLLMFVSGPCKFLTQQSEDLYLKSVVLFRSMYQYSVLNDKQPFFMEYIAMFKQFSIIFALRGMRVFIYSLEAMAKVCERYNNHGPKPITEHILEQRFAVFFPGSIKLNTGTFKERLYSTGEKIDRIYSGYLKCDYVSHLSSQRVMEMCASVSVYCQKFGSADKAGKLLTQIYPLIIKQLQENPHYFPVDLQVLVFCCMASICQEQWVQQIFFDFCKDAGKDYFDVMAKAEKFALYKLI